MVSLSEARSQLQTAKASISETESSLAKQEKTLEQQQREIQQTKFPARTLTFQSKYGNQPRITQKKEVFQSQKQAALSDVFRAKQQLKSYKSGELADYKKEVSDYESQLAGVEAKNKQIADYNRDLEMAKKWANNELPRSQLANKRQKEFYDEIKAGYDLRQQRQQEIARLEAEGLKPVYSGGKLTGFEDPIAGMSIPLSTFQSETGYIRPITKTQSSLSPTLQTSKTFSTVTEFKKPSGFLEGLQSDIFSRQATLETQRARGQGTIFTGMQETALGFGSAFVSGGIFAKQLVTQPITTIKQTGTGIFNIGKSIVTGKGMPQIGEAIRQRPSFMFGRVAGEAAIFKGSSYAPKLVTKGSDIFRTRGLKEIPKESVIAPEYFKGQSYPRIRQGQTAGELLGEFKTQGFGFTATPKPFKASTEALRGTSELPGVYQAPKLSPKFLRVSGEPGQKLFSFKVFGTLKPSAVRIKPLDFELTPFVKPGQKNIASLKQAKSFYETAPKGKSYVPFIKTEKEAIIPFGTQLKQTGKSGYFKFEGRRIPIYDYEAIGGTLKASNKKTFSTIEDIYSSSSSRRIGKTSRYNPLDVASSSRIFSRSKSSIAARPSDGLKRKGGSYKSSFLPSKSRPSYGLKRKSSITSTSGISSRTSPFISRTSYGSSYSSSLGFSFPRQVRRTRKDKKKRYQDPFGIKTNKKLTQKTKYTPSFTALGFQITSKKKTPKALKGYLPTIRPILR